MVTKANIDEFLAQREIAVVGVSRNGRKFGSTIYRALKSKDYHYADCPYVKSITPDDLQTGPAPPAGKTLHQGCPRK